MTILLMFVLTVALMLQCCVRLSVVCNELYVPDTGGEPCANSFGLRQ